MKPKNQIAAESKVSGTDLLKTVKVISSYNVALPRADWKQEMIAAELKLMRTNLLKPLKEGLSQIASLSCP